MEANYCTDRNIMASCEKRKMKQEWITTLKGVAQFHSRQLKERRVLDSKCSQANVSDPVTNK